jgi:Tfp pilus assembly PilM family ATPase
MIRWKLKKTVPFRVEEAHVDYQLFPSPGEDGSWTCLTTLVQQAVLEQYEVLFRDLDLHLGLIDLSTFTLVNLHLPEIEATEGDALILNVTGAFFALFVLRRGTPIFYRARSYAATNGAGAAALPPQVAREMEPSLAYYRERLGGAERPRILLRCADLEPEDVAGALAERLGLEVSLLDPSRRIEVVPRGDEAAHRRMLQRIGPALGAALGRDS